MTRTHSTKFTKKAKSINLFKVALLFLITWFHYNGNPSNPASFTCVYEANSIEQDGFSCGYIVWRSVQVFSPMERIRSKRDCRSSIGQHHFVRDGGRKWRSCWLVEEHNTPNAQLENVRWIGGPHLPLIFGIACRFPTLVKDLCDQFLPSK